MALIKGTLTAEDKSASVTFMFNPKEYSISKSNSWNIVDAKKGSDTPPLHFGGGQPKQLKLQLLFDTYKTGADVRTEYTDKLFKMMEIHPRLPKDKTNKSSGSPPKLLLSWGEVFSFYCYLESLSVQFTLFLESGTPVRATADLGLKQAVDEKAQPGTNPTSAGEGGERVRLVQPQDRLDLIAYNEYDDAGRWRAIADANGIVDPLSIKPGQSLIIPALVSGARS